MSSSFIRHGNLYVVPIIRQRLNFAVLVRQAVHELDLGPNDLIAVELPASFLDKVLVALKALPKVSLVVASFDGGDEREVVPITPADGIVEAIRLATDGHIPLAAIDAQLAPGHLGSRHCISDPSWPDDDLVIERGCESYLELVGPHLTHPPARIEPVDTWRDAYMAHELQQLYPYHNRILFVCDMTHATPIRALIRRRAQQNVENYESPSARSVSIWRPSLPVLLRYLDDMPHLVEVFEEHRQRGFVEQFRKRSAVLNLIHQLDQQSDDLRFSIRHYQAFAQLLANMLERRLRISPSWQDIATACDSCFSKPFSERVKRKLLGYYDQVNVERVEPNGFSEEEYTLRSSSDSHEKRFVLRSCNPLQQGFRILPLFPAESEGSEAVAVRGKEAWHDESRDSNGTHWHPRYEFADKMRLKAFMNAGRAQHRIKTSQFSGSLQAGIAMRPTLGSYLTASPRIHVRKSVRTEIPSVDKYEPIVWLFDPQRPGDEGKFSSAIFGPVEGPQYLVEWHFATSEEEKYKSNELTIMHRTIRGSVFFADSSMTLDRMKKEPEEELEKRIPNNGDFGTVGRIHNAPLALSHRVNEGATWWELLLETSLLYARDRVLWILPTAFAVPKSVIATAITSGKKVHRIALGLFTQGEQTKLRNSYLMYSPHSPVHAELNDPKQMSYLTQLWSPIMKRFWDFSDDI